MLKTFSIGGVHPHENKLSAHQPIVTAEVPAKAVILLGQHIGAPAKPIVAKGDVVKVGTKIAEANGFVSAAIHSSVSGKVAKIDSIVDASGYAKPAIFIDVDGDEWEESIDRSPELVKECELTSEEIVKKIADAGIVGLGGACFPTQVKLCPPPSFKAECVIINAVECEPYLTADHQLMLEHAEEVMVGVAILMKAVKVNKAFIGIENNKSDAIQLMTKVASSYAGIEVVPLKVKYPQGGEKQLIDAITKRQVASGALPISTGAVVQNVGTAFAVYQAVQKNKPLFERVITVTGKSVAQPSNFLARIGTPMQQLIDACGGYVKTWELLNEPMQDWPDPTQLKTGMKDGVDVNKDNTQNSNFYWQDFLGKDYAVKALEFARKHGGEDIKLFVNEYGLEGIGSKKLQGFLDYVKYIDDTYAQKFPNSRGVDGIATQMHVSYYLDAAKQVEFEASIENMFTKLAATGKLVKISELDMGLVAEDGTDIMTADVTEEQHRKMADFYTFIIKKYFEIIPQPQRYGITQWCQTDAPVTSGWRGGQPVGIWDLDYNRKLIYEGYVNGLKQN